MDQKLNQSVIKATEEVFASLLGALVQPGLPEERPVNNGIDEATIIGEDYSIHVNADPGDTVSHIPFKASDAAFAVDVYLR